MISDIDILRFSLLSDLIYIDISLQTTDMWYIFLVQSQYKTPSGIYTIYYL